MLGYALLVVGGIAGWLFWKQEKKAAVNQSYLDNANNIAKTLQQGMGYVVKMMVQPSDPTWIQQLALVQGQSVDQIQAADFIRQSLAQYGWQIPEGQFAPTLYTDQDLKNYQTNQPSQWVFTGVWTRPEQYMTQAPSWAPMMIPYSVTQL